ncbi:hypothetical protein MTO96_031077 [Rhipicephalus appendiculatus]
MTNPPLTKPRPPVTPSPVLPTPERPSQHLRPSQGPGGDVCTSYICRFASQWLRPKLDETKNPCEDFYGYVCGNHTGGSQWYQIEVAIRYLNMRFLNGSRIPLKNQVAWQKAAGMYKTCISFVEANRSETGDLARWMISMDLDFNNQTRLFATDPIDIMIRGSLDLGVHAILSFSLWNTWFYKQKRIMVLQLSAEEGVWLDARGLSPPKVNIDHYANLLRLYGVQPRHDRLLASSIVEYENNFRNIVNKHGVESPFYVDIGGLPYFTRPFITRERWVNPISKYTNGTYTAADKIVVEQPGLKVLVDILNSTMGENGLRYLVAWSIYRQLVGYTVPHMLTKGRTASDACYEHASKTMQLALLSSYFQTVVIPSMVEAVKTMLSNIRDALREEFESSSWVTGDDRKLVIRKLAYMSTYVGSAGGRLEHDYLERLYKPYPDVPPDRLFPSWIKALSLSSHYRWADTRTWLYDETQVNAFYEYRTNVLVVPTAIIARPMYYDGAPPAINYGGLGAIVGHEMMHAYDVSGTGYNDMAELRPWASTAFTREYFQRLLCIRRSHSAAIQPQARQALREPTDAENLADFVGARLAYNAFSSLPQPQRRRTLVGLDISAERLFFIAHCITLCSDWKTYAPQYAPDRSRCIVPLMNMPEFSNAFGCAAGQPMNPTDKCNFWS